MCGPPCTPKTCADFSGFDCGTFPDGCGNQVTCGTCSGGICNQTTHTCCTENTCNATYANACGQNLPNGCGSNSVGCACPAGETCTENGGASPAPASGTPGACCTPSKTVSTYTAAGQCGTNLANGCGGNDVTVTCANGSECVANGETPASGVVGTCCTPANCGSVASGTCAKIPDTCITGKTVACNECTSPKTCVNGDECCTPAPACPANTCNTTVDSIDCGSPRTCGCGSGQTCVCSGGTCTATSGPGTCEATPTCASKYPNECGTDLPTGITGGATLNCPCSNGHTCSSATPGTAGTCSCSNGLGAPYTCANVPDGPDTGGPQCGSFNNGCGGTVSCGCGTGQTCDNGSCCTLATCPVGPTVGSKCGSLSNNCGGTIGCACPSGKDNENFACTAGACTCVPDTCEGRVGTFTDNCGGVITCSG